ncbi:hypothetical protein RB195_012799 [Necator americanus]|uniref:SAM domain-containing protein n=1 Tax=Necator americanus TaxID=51031 RepID=A0ABR1DSM8_NECAM
MFVQVTQQKRSFPTDIARGRGFESVVLPSMCDWQSFFIKIGIPAGVSSRYAEVFRQNRVSKDMLPDLDKATLADLGVTAVGDQLAILRSAKDASLEMGSVTPSKLRIRITGPESDSFLPGGSVSMNVATGNGEKRRGRPPPDRHEIYHIKMPEGNTARTKKIMENANMMRKHGLAVRGTTGVRQGGRSVSPVDKKSAAVVRRNQEREEVLVSDPIITRLGVRGLHSDVTSKLTSGKVRKWGLRNGASHLSCAGLSQPRGDVAVRVQLPSSNGVVRRISTAPRTSIATSILNRTSRDRTGNIPLVTVKLRGAAQKERAAVRLRTTTERKPVHMRLGRVTSSGRLARSAPVRQKPFARPVFEEEEEEEEEECIEEEMSEDHDEYSNEEMIWEEEEQFDEYVEETRPTVYNRLSR